MIFRFHTSSSILSVIRIVISNYLTFFLFLCTLVLSIYDNQKLRTLLRILFGFEFSELHQILVIIHRRSEVCMICNLEERIQTQDQ